MAARELATREALPLRRGGGFLHDAIAGQLSAHTRRAYGRDIASFLNWLSGQSLSPGQWQRRPGALGALRKVKRGDVIAYRSYLARGYAPLSVNRKMATLRSLLSEATAQGLIPASPAAGIRGLKVNGEYQATPALTRSQSRALLEAPGTSTLIGLRDRALLHLALRTGLRCAEITSLRVGDLSEEQGHHVLRVKGKNEKMRRVKVATEVWRELQAWIEKSGRGDRPGAFLFVQARKIGRGKAACWLTCEKPLSSQAIWKRVKAYLRSVVGGNAERFGPHTLRATFITLALKGGAALHKVQAAAGHADPRTTMRYARLADDLDDNAADYVRLNGED